MKPTIPVATSDPTSSPTYQPSDKPSNASSNAPTMKPTLQPTIDHSMHENFIGDYKISAQNSSHGNWLLCDGSFVDIYTYPLLYDVIKHSFGSLTGNSSLFALPNASDRVAGINGDINEIGTIVGEE